MSNINKVPNNQVLISNLFSRKISKFISDEIDIEETFFDIADSIIQYMNSISLDKRGVAITADYHQRVWETISTKSSATKQTVFNNMNLLSQIIISLLKPADSLVLVPDQYLITVATLDKVGSSLTFVNDQSLFNFENFVITNDSYPFSGNYSVVDYQDLIDENFSEKYDFIFTGSIAVHADNSLLNILVNSLNEGGCLLVADSSFMGEMYVDVASVYNTSLYHDTLESTQNIYVYHVPFGIGFDVIIKK